MRSRQLVPFAAIVLLAACAPVDLGLGEALKYDMAVQTIDPDPVYPDTGAKPGDAGTTAASAAERYRKGTVKAVERVTATSSSSGSGPQ